MSTTTERLGELEVDLSHIGCPAPLEGWLISMHGRLLGRFSAPTKAAARCETEQVHYGALSSLLYEIA